MSKNKKKRGVSWAEAYETPSHQGSLGGVERFARAQSVSIGRARQALQPLLSYTLHEPRRRRFPTLPVVVLGMDEQWVADLVEMQTLKKWNRGVRYLLTVVDVLSKYAWVEPLKDKTGKAVAVAFERILKRAKGRQPLRLQTDAGKEFYNRVFQSVMTRHNIHHFSTRGDTKVSVVERFNRTLKERMYRYFTARNTYRYVDALPYLVQGYNATKHRSIGMAPRDVTRARSARCGNVCTANAWPVTCVHNGNRAIASDYRNSTGRSRKGICPAGPKRYFSSTGPCRDPWPPIKSRNGTESPLKAPSMNKTCRKSTCRTTRCFAWRKYCSVHAKRSRCVGKAGPKSTTVGFPSVVWPRYESSSGLDARPVGGAVGGAVGPYAECPATQPKDLDGYDGTIGGQVRAQEGEEGQEGPEEEEAPCQEEASLQEGPARVPGQVARHGQARQERHVGHDATSVGASVPPGRSRVEGLAQTVQFA